MADPVKEVQAEMEQEQPVDTSDPKQVNKARKKEARTRAYRLEFVKAGMSHPQGRSWFYDMLLFCKVNGMLFNDDPYRTAFNLGQQNVGNRILDDIQTIAPDDYIQMIRENKSKNG